MDVHADQPTRRHSGYCVALSFGVCGYETFLVYIGKQPQVVKKKIPLEKQTPHKIVLSLFFHTH